MGFLEKGALMVSKSVFAEELDVVTEKIIGCAFKVNIDLGAGFVEKVYENALAHELQKINLRFNNNIQPELNMTTL